MTSACFRTERRGAPCCCGQIRPQQRTRPRLVREELVRLGADRLAVIVPGSRVGEVRRTVAEAVPDSAAAGEQDLEGQVVVLEVTQAKGLESDTVIVADPGRILVDSDHGLNDLYVALTRATQCLGIVHSGPRPAVLRTLEPP